MTDVALQATDFVIELRRNQDSEIKKLSTSTIVVRRIFFIPLLSTSKKIPSCLNYLILWITLKVLAKMYMNSICTQGVINLDQNFR